MAPTTAALGAAVTRGAARKAAVAGGLRDGGPDMLGEAWRRLKTLGAWRRGGDAKQQKGIVALVVGVLRGLGMAVTAILTGGGGSCGSSAFFLWGAHIFPFF